MLGLGLQAARILANLIVMGSGIMIRAFAQAYRQALASKFFLVTTFSTFGRITQTILQKYLIMINSYC